ncbi:MAG TPA: ketopantoate reductase family protein [Candidatus Omnitrophota bacterium]|nr:ketopantoate reductase family protein [Candidatus Omnitrophota bacterium]
MKIAVIGSGAIGGLVAGYLKHRKEDVFLVGRGKAVEAIAKDGLHISGVRGNIDVRVDAFHKLEQKADLVILAMKTQDLEKFLKDNPLYLKDALVLTTQNGIQAEKILAHHIRKDKIISSIVMFGSTYTEPNNITHNFDGKWIIGRLFGENDAKLQEVAAVLNRIFPVVLSNDILGMKWLKVFVNANNCLPAILGKSMQETFKRLGACRISIAIWKEGLELTRRTETKLASLPDFPLERAEKLTAMPVEEAAKIFSGIMTNLSRQPLYGSILQSIKRGKPSEIDYINGEFVRLAKGFGLSAPLNNKLVNLVHKVERTKKFLSLAELTEETKEFLQ